MTIAILRSIPEKIDDEVVFYIGDEADKLPEGNYRLCVITSKKIDVDSVFINMKDYDKAERIIKELVKGIQPNLVSLDYGELKDALDLKGEGALLEAKVKRGELNKVISQLPFQPRATVINLIAGNSLSLEDLSRLTDKISESFVTWSAHIDEKMGEKVRAVVLGVK